MYGCDHNDFNLVVYMVGRTICLVQSRSIHGWAYDLFRHAFPRRRRSKPSVRVLFLSRLTAPFLFQCMLTCGIPLRNDVINESHTGTERLPGDGGGSDEGTTGGTTFRLTGINVPLPGDVLRVWNPMNTSSGLPAVRAVVRSASGMGDQN